MITINHTRPATVGLISDTHGWLDPRFHELFASVDLIIHAGDIGHESVLVELESIAPVAAVRGNIDGGELRFLPLELLVEVNTRRIAILHIAGSHKRPNLAARELLKRRLPDMLVVGHSHVPVVAKVGAVLWVNPGAAGRQGFHTERFAALLHIDFPQAKVTMDRIHLGPRSSLSEG
ncbi:MAG: metallophosphoesterase family protein [Bradymonadaceae bacterium]|nr:metallophosphoesterase family protein [Lujinxingiaceae bacterium]